MTEFAHKMILFGQNCPDFMRKALINTLEGCIIDLKAEIAKLEQVLSEEELQDQKTKISLREAILSDNHSPMPEELGHQVQTLHSYLNQAHERDLLLQLSGHTEQKVSE